MYTYFYNVNSNRKVLHLDGCQYLINSQKQEFGEKHSLEKALSKGFSLCKHCMTIQNRFVNKHLKFGGSYSKYNYTYTCGKDYLEITTGKGKWKILYGQYKPVLELYHQNKEMRDTDSLSRIAGYHYQHVQEYEFDDIIYYIYLHDGKLKVPPQKGSKKYKNWQKKNKKLERRAAIDNVLMLIDSLHSA